MKNKLLKSCLFLFISITILCYGEEDNSNITIKSSYDTEYSMDYKNVPFSIYINSNPVTYLQMGLAFGKGLGDEGYYPGGILGFGVFNIYESAGFYIELSELDHLKTLIIGNYIPVLGLGVLFGKPYPLLLGMPYLELARVGNYLRPKATTSKSMILEGIALDYSVYDYSFKLFLSWNRFDSSCGDSDYYKYNDNDWDGISNDEDEDDFTGYGGKWSYDYSSKTELFSSIRGDVDYSTDFGRDNRNNLRESIIGFNISKERGDSLYGLTYVYSYFNRLVDPYYNFDPESGDKTGYYFRGDWYMNAGFYFKKKTFFDLFGELGTSYYRNKSYFDDFNGTSVFSVGAAGGIRKKIGNTGILLWGVYLPPMFVNPHCQEYPEGERNLSMILLDTIWYRGIKKFDFWCYIYSEIYDKDDPGLEERGISMNFRVRYPLILKMKFNFSQKLEITDNYYYAPGVLSYRMVSKLSFKKVIAEFIFTGFRGEIRYGSPQYGNVNIGYYLGPEAIYKNRTLLAGISLYYYNANNSPFSYVYPYRNPLFKWSFIPYGLYGEGFTGSLRAAIYNLGSFDVGLKIEQRVDISDKSKNDTSFYVLTSYSF